MIDGADNGDEQFLVDYLTDLGIKQLEYLILTHPDADHSGGQAVSRSIGERLIRD